jgi:hypothetical protein
LVTVGGSGLDWHHVDSYFRPNAIGRYSFDDQNNIAFNKFDKLFDLAITMDCSQCPVHPQLKPIFTEQTARFAETVQKHDAEPVFFRSWAYADKPEMTAQLGEQYTSPGNANHALVVPAGIAFARSIEKPPILIFMHPTSGTRAYSALTSPRRPFSRRCTINRNREQLHGGCRAFDR